jgi:hypothetical protein
MEAVSKTSAVKVKYDSMIAVLRSNKQYYTVTLDWNTNVFLIGIGGSGVQLGPLGTAATNRPIVPGPVDYDDSECGGMIRRGNQSTRRKPAPVPLCPPRTPHDLPGR